MFRIRFTSDDLARTRVVTSYGPYAEALFGLGLLADPRANGALFGGWRQRVAATPGGEMATRGWAGSLGRLLRGEPILDLFTLIGPVTTAEEGAQAVLRIGRDQLRAEVDAAARWAMANGPGVPRALPAWLHRLHDDRDIRSSFATALHASCRATIDPHWSGIRIHLENEASVVARVLAQRGVAGLLDNLHPAMRWCDGALEVCEVTHVTDQIATALFPHGEVGAGGSTSELRLHGRGLVLVPSVFCQRITPYLSVADHDSPAVLFYPALRDVREAYRLWTRHALGSTHKALAALLGTTRSAALEILAVPCTTTQLAERLRVSLATASHHATVLRDAGLVTTRRHGSAVLHIVSPLGLSLLRGDCASGAGGD